MVTSDPVKMNLHLLQPTNKLAVVVTALAFAVTPTMIGAEVGRAVIGDTCLVPVYHTNFSFPPEGGKIVKIGEQMYFVQNYRPECANAGASGQLIKGSPNSTVSGTTTPSVTTTQDNSNCIDQL